MSERVPKKRGACKETSPVACSHHQPQTSAPVADISEVYFWAPSTHSGVVSLPGGLASGRLNGEPSDKDSFGTVHSGLCGREVHLPKV